MEEERKLVPPEERDRIPVIRDYGMPFIGQDGMMGGRKDIYVSLYTSTRIAQEYMDLDMDNVLHQITQKAAELFPGTKWLLFSGNEENRNFEFTSNMQMWKALEYGECFNIRYLEVRLEPADNKHNVTCKHCQLWIVGHRFKCLECRAYDICASCEGRSVHGEHAMLRIVDPERTNIPEWVKIRIRL